MYRLARNSVRPEAGGTFHNVAHLSLEVLVDIPTIESLSNLEQQAQWDNV